MPEPERMPAPTAPAALTTPCLLVDLEVLERNVQRMADRAKSGGFALRPHAKTHKCPQIAQRQFAAGAVGLTVATIGEAEAFNAAGIDDLFIAYPLWLDEGKRERVTRLAQRAAVRVGIDSVEGAQRVVGTGASVVVEVDSGFHRTGVKPAQAGALALAAHRLGLKVDGVFTFPGHGHSYDGTRSAHEVREQAARDQDAALAEAGKSLRDAGLEPAVLSGGSTPTAGLWQEGPVNELRPGVYVFNDATQVALGSCTLADVALTAAATVVSVPAADRFVVDAGGKVLGADLNPWAGNGFVVEYPGSKVIQLSEHHAVVQLPEGSAMPRHGDVVSVVPTHVCATVNLADEFVVVREGRIVDLWPVAARGMNS